MTYHQSLRNVGLNIEDGTFIVQDFQYDGISLGDRFINERDVAHGRVLTLYLITVLGFGSEPHLFSDLVEEEFDYLNANGQSVESPNRLALTLKISIQILCAFDRFFKENLC